MNTRGILPMALVALALVACGGSKPATKATAPKAVAKAATAPSATTGPAPDQAKPAEPDWSYSSVGKRDPFRSFLADIDKAAAGLATRCATPLGKFEIEQLRLVAVVTGLEDPVAMVEAPNGVGYAVRRGACVGKNGGTVAAVRSGEVVVSEWAIRADGNRDRTQTVIKLPKEAALNLEE
jgi:type IV pilus assembly protein PilP